MPRFHTTTIERSAIVLALGPSASPRSPLAAELRSLLTGLGYEPVAELRQRRPEPNAALPLGSGKLRELEELLAEARATTDGTTIIASATDLPSGHLRNLEKALGAPVIDRTEVILRIFEARAESPLAKLEIERSRLVHSLPRIRDQAAAQRQEGGGGRAAKGHSSTELAKQAAEKRIAELGRRIAVARSERARHMARRTGVPRVALVGYTNVGKSSWMAALTRRSVSVKDELFHTLSTRVHALRGAGEKVLVADTVGFLDELPHTLVESFRSTLEEALDADLLLHVADASSPRLEAQLAVTRSVLASLGAHLTPELLVLNKADQLTPEARAELERMHPDALVVSAHSAEDCRRLVEHIRALTRASPTSVGSRASTA